MSIGPNYRSTAHIAGIDLEKVSGAMPAGGKASFTGTSTKNSGEIRIIYENTQADADMAVGTADANKYSYYAREMYVCRRHGPASEIRRPLCRLMRGRTSTVQAGPRRTWHRRRSSSYFFEAVDVDGR